MSHFQSFRREHHWKDIICRNASKLVSYEFYIVIKLIEIIWFRVYFPPRNSYIIIYFITVPCARTFSYLSISFHKAHTFPITAEKYLASEHYNLWLTKSMDDFVYCYYLLNIFVERKYCPCSFPLKMLYAKFGPIWFCISQDDTTVRSHLRQTDTLQKIKWWIVRWPS
jgi:hypothetical protein